MDILYPYSELDIAIPVTKAEGTLSIGLEMND
jgi:hypothetical protein